jgi:hypothetical protein
MRCSEATAEGGPAPSIAYVSENVASSRAPRIGFAPPQRYLLESAAGKIFDRATRARAMAELRRYPNERLALYWLAVALELDGDRGAARSLFESLAGSQAGPAWVRRWSWLRIADIAVAEGKPTDARRFALDLASSAFEPPLLVLASAGGLAYGWGDCRSTDLALLRYGLSALRRLPPSRDRMARTAPRLLASAGANRARSVAFRVDVGDTITPLGKLQRV